MADNSQDQSEMRESVNKAESPDSHQVTDSSTTNRATKLKESINEKLAQNGINTGTLFSFGIIQILSYIFQSIIDFSAGQNIQIKIIRVNDDDEVEEWSDQTTNDVANSVHKTIIAYVVGIPLTLIN